MHLGNHSILLGDTAHVAKGVLEYQDSGPKPVPLVLKTQ
jgi:hypothetical protein